MNLNKVFRVPYSSRVLNVLFPYKYLTRYASYRVRVHTGSYRGAGTEAKVHIKIYGNSGRTDTIFLDNSNLIGCVIDPNEVNETDNVDTISEIDSMIPFERHSVCEFLIDADKHLGRLEQIRIGHDNSGIGPGWFLNKVVIIDLFRNKKVIFPSEKWIGTSDYTNEKNPWARILIPGTIQAGDKLLPFSSSNKMLQLRAGATSFPHPNKVRLGKRATNKKNSGFAGEDAYFIGRREAENFRQDFIGVADGVAEWSLRGIDAGAFSQSLMTECNHLVQSVQSDEKLLPLDMLKIAFDQNNKNNILGSTTACLISTDPNLPLLHTAYIGDSGYIVIRFGLKKGYRIVYRSPEQEKTFGCPFQLGHHDGSDSPNDCIILSHVIEVGDVVVVGSDGLFDNLGDDTIADIVGETLKKSAKRGFKNKQKKSFFSSCNPQEVARNICFAAFETSRDKKADTPWSNAATEEFNQIYCGGKLDDITVVVGFVEAHE